MATRIKRLTLGDFGTNCYVLGKDSGDGAIVIDPVDDAATIIRSAGQAGWQIRLILATHGHLDHVLAAGELIDRTGAPFYIHRRTPRLQPIPVADPFLQQLFPALPRPDHCFGDERETTGIDGIALETIYTPGHSPDHVAFYLPGENVLFGGDCLFAGSIGRTDFPNSDHNTLMRSIAGQLLTLPDETRVLPGHMEPTTIGVERATNPFVLDWLRRGAANDGVHL